MNNLGILSIFIVWYPKDYNKIFSIVIILKLMERSDSTIRHSSFDIIHSKGDFIRIRLRIYKISLS